MNEITRIPKLPVRALDGSELRKKAALIVSDLGGSERLDLPSLGRAIAEGEALLADPQFQLFMAGLKMALAPPSLAQVKREVARLLVCFQNQHFTDEDIAVFTEIAIEEIREIEALSLLSLVMGFGELRRTMKFRPTICEMINAVEGAFGADLRGHEVLKLGAMLDRAKRHLAQRETSPDAPPRILERIIDQP
jgi:hypothetical protein